MNTLKILFTVVALFQGMQVMVQDSDGKKKCFDVTKNTTIKQLRSNIKKFCPEFKDCTRLLHLGKTLLNFEATMQMLNVQPGHTFHYALNDTCMKDCCKSIGRYFFFY